MPFLKVKSTSIYLEVTNTPKLIRPLWPETEGRWCHTIPTVTGRDPQGKQTTIRKFTMVDAEFSNWMKDNPDPFWDKLGQMDQTNKQNERRDFPMRPINLLPVWDYSANDGKGDVKLVKQGNQFFEEMVKWHDQGNNVMDCDWMCWTEGEGRKKQYKTSRQDKSPFQCPISQEELQRKCQQVMNKGLSDLRPFNTEEELLKYIHGTAMEEATSFNFGANAQPQNQMPSYTPGGQPAGPQLGTPQPLPPAQPPQQPPFQQSQVQPAQQPAFQQPQPQQAHVGGPVQQTQTNQPPNMPSQGAQSVPTPPPQQNWSPQPPQTPQQPPMPPQQQWQPPQAPQPQQQFQQPTQQPQQQQEVANAPVSSKPVYLTPAPATQAPQQPQQQFQPQQPQQSQEDPGSIILDNGKHKGKTLRFVVENDPQYLTYLKGNKKELIPAIEALQSGAPGSQPQQQQLPQQQPPQQPASGNGSADAVDDEATRQQLVQTINEKCLQVPDFQGPGIANNMIPFLESTIGTANFSDAPLADLQKLNQALDSRLGG